MQERAKRKAEQQRASAIKAEAKSQHYFDRSNKDREFLSLAEPIKVGHHSEKRHRKAIEEAWNNTGKAVEMHDKAREHERKAESWERRQKDINLSIPESLEYYKEKLEQAIEYHQGLKSGKYPKEHAYSMAYANKVVKDLKKQVELATILWA